MLHRKSEKHYPAELWVDFVRGLVEGQDGEAMQAHLDAGCDLCRELAGFFAKVGLRATADAQIDVPDYAVRYARAIYALQQPDEVLLLPRMIARLVYDSFNEPLLAGVRSEHRMTHQLMYVAGPYCVDLRLEQERGAPQVTLVGQIADRERNATGVGDVPVFLMSRSSIVSRAVSNKFGEFAMEYTPTNSLRLYAPVPGESHGIEVRLGRVASANAERKLSS